MSIELYLSFVLASIVVLIVPGPTVILVISYALARGWRVALASVAGVGLGDLTSVTLSLIGLSAVLSVSATLFALLKWVGALYLIWLGIKLWRTRPDAPAHEEDQRPEASRGTRRGEQTAMMRRTWVVTALNPKAIAFYVAFMPHFVAPEAPVVPQLVLLGATFVILGVVNALVYAVFAGSVRESLRSARVFAWTNRIGGTCLIGAGIMTAALRRAA